MPRKSTPTQGPHEAVSPPDLPKADSPPDLPKADSPPDPHEAELRQANEMLFYAYRDFIAEPD